MSTSSWPTGEWSKSGPIPWSTPTSLDREKREPLQIPLKTAAVPESGEFTLQLDAIQEIAEGSGAVSITLPRPEAKAATRAVVAVLPADNVELTIADSDLQGLEKEPFPPQVELPVRQQSPLFFRERSDAKSAVLGAALRLRERAVSVASHDQTQGRGDASAGAAASRLPRRLRTLADAGVAGLPRDAGLRRLEDPGGIPGTAVQRSDRGRTLGGGAGQRAAESGAGRPARPACKWICLAERIGQIDVLLQYELPTPAPGLTGTSLMQVPLAVPAAGADTVVTTSRLEIDAGQDAQVQLQSGGWDREDRVRAARGP